MRPGLALGLYGLLAASAGVALWAQRSPDSVPGVLAASAPYIFLLFSVGFAAYRFALVAARRYPAFKAFFQVALTAVFFMLLMRPAENTLWREPAGAADVTVTLLSDPNPRVRALAAELARHRPPSHAGLKALVMALDDGDASVRDEAHRSLVELNQGRDLGLSATGWKEL